MRKLFSGPDSEMNLIYQTLVIGSMILTGYFGWLLGSGLLPLQIVLAVVFAAVSRAVGTNFERSASYRAQGLVADANRCFFVGCCFAIANIITDFGAAAAYRDLNIVRTKNINTVAKDVRDEIKRLETRVSEIKATTQFQTTYLAPEAYDGLIASAELARDNEAKRGGCKIKCEEKTAKLASLQADKANAMHRQGLISEMKQLESELTAARLKSAENKIESNPAIAQVKAVVAWFTFQKDQSDTQVFWGNNSIMLLVAFLMTIGIIHFGLEVGRTKARVMAEAPVAQNPHIPDYRDFSERRTEPKTEPVDYRSWDNDTRGKPGNSYTIIQNGKKTSVTGDWDAFDQKIAEALRFCEARGTA